MPRAYPDEFRVRAVSLIRAGQTVRKTASDLDVSCAILHRWVKQDKIDRGEIPADHLQHVANELNERPRKALDWDTPAERLYALLQENK